MGEVYNGDLEQSYDKSAAAQTDTELVAARANRTIKVASVVASAVSAQTVSFESGGTTEKFYLEVGAGITADPCAPAGEYLFKCVEGESLDYTTTAAVSTSVSVLYLVE